MSELIYNVQEVFDSSTRRGCLQQYGCSAYRIPPYQRGYKWGSAINQPVERLLSDVKQAWKSKAKEYLLQAITVKKVSDGQNGWVLEVIDGQQRLTTLFILIHAMNHRIEKAARPNIAEHKLRYSIRHEAPILDDLVASWIESIEDSPINFDQLKAAHNVDHESRQDCHYLKCAALRCVHDLGSALSFQTDTDVADFRKFVFEEVKLMVNAVEAHVAGEVIFGNLNSNRVDLTEKELIKGLLLTRVAREPGATRPRHYREVLEMRIQLGREWDEINHWANLPEIRSLYFHGFGDGMTGLLELVARQIVPNSFKPFKKASEGEKLLFEYFLRQPHFEPIFHLLANTYSRLKDWYTNDETYHLLGYCLMNKKSADRLPFLAMQLSCKTKPEFKKRLHDLRRSILLGGEKSNGDVDFGELGYGENDQIKFILLALSVFQSVNGGRFNFHAYESEDWSLEHIFPQTPFGKGAKLNDTQKKAALEILIDNGKTILSEEVTEKLARYRDATGVLDMEDEIGNLLQSEPLLHQIGNLCLLSSKDNSAMGCGMFNEKRKVIRDRIARGSFVPRHTYEVFSKMIGVDDSLDVWSKPDIIKHQGEIEKRIRALMEVPA